MMKKKSLADIEEASQIRNNHCILMRNIIAQKIYYKKDGTMYYLGQGVDQNYREAAKWYEKAADMSDSWGLCNLGYCYYYGRDISVDYEKAYSCFSHSSFLGNSNAMYKLGDMFYHGYYIKEDKAAAFFWYSEANRGHAVKSNVEYRLGLCYLYGHGIGQNIERALQLLKNSRLGFLKQIEEGDAFAELTLSRVRTEINNAKLMIYRAKKMITQSETQN